MHNDKDLTWAEVEDLVREAKSGDARATNDLIAYCRPLIVTQIAKLQPKPTTFTHEDWMQIGRIAVWKALGGYDVNRRAWLGYAQTAVRRALRNARDREFAYTHTNMVGGSEDFAQDCNMPEDKATAIERLMASEACEKRDCEIKRELDELASKPSLHEIAKRRKLKRPLAPEEPLALREVKALNRDRLSLLTLLIQRGTRILPPALQPVR